jgi:hypothetical protein
LIGGYVAPVHPWSVAGHDAWRNVSCQSSDAGNWINIIELDNGNVTLLPFQFDGSTFSKASND